MTRGIRTLVLSLALVLAVAIGGCAGEEPADNDGGAATSEPIRIGAVLSLTGSYAGLGVPEKNAIELEVDRINADGGINGRPIDVIVVDDGTDTAAAQAAVSQLIDQENVVAILGATGTGQSMAMRPDIERARVPQVSMAGGSLITDEFSDWVFQTPWPNRVVVPFDLQFMKDSGITRIGMIADSGGYGKDGVAVTERFADEFGMTVVAKESFNAGDADMTAQLTKIKAANPDAVILWAAGSEGATILKNWDSLGGTAPFFGTPGNARKELIQGAGSAADGFSFAAGHILLPQSYGADTKAYDIATDFIDRYTGEYGTEPDIFAGHAYDALGVVVDALLRMPEGDIDPGELRDEIEKIDGWIGIGGTFTYSADDHNGLTEKDLVMYRIADGTWTLAEEPR
ncbi:MAG: ABC transporter substrate-binding protein [Coriobacteriia bacterium]